MSKQGSSGIPLKGVNTNPVQVPYELLQEQPRLGVQAAMLWIHLAGFAQRGEAVTVQSLAQAMGVERTVVENNLVALADNGWINDEGMEIRLCVPQDEGTGWDHAGAGASRRREQTMAPPTMLDAAQAQFEWLVNFWSSRVGDATQEVMQKLVFWLEEKELSHEVIAVAVEEMCENAERPTLSYLEGVLRNWYNEGVREYAHLTERPHLAKVLPKSSERRIHPGAEQKWKELFPHEFDQ